MIGLIGIPVAFNHQIWGAMKAYGWAEPELEFVKAEWQDSEAGALRVLVAGALRVLVRK